VNRVRDVGTTLLQRRFVRFLLVGGLNTLFGYSVYALLIFLHVHYALAALGGQVLGVLFNFKTIGLLVFDRRGNRRFLRFVSVYLLTYLLTALLLKIFHAFDVNLYLAGALLILPMAVLSYFLNRNFVFIDDART
jgi:putative flippase GtrA